MPTCFVPGCKSGYRSQKNENKRHFFFPPKDKQFLDKWNAAIPRKDKELTRKCYVCDVHFKEEFVIKSDKSVELPRQKWKLHPDAVPHIFPNLPKYLTQLKKPRKPPASRKMSATKTKKKLHGNTDSQLNFLESMVVNNTEQEQNMDQINALPATYDNPKFIAARRALQASERRFRLLKMKIRKLQVQKSELENRLAHISKSRLDVKKLPPKSQLVVDMIAQRHKRKGKTGLRYEPEYILECLLFWIKSPKGYNHCARHGLLPLPSRRTLQRLYRGIKCSYGINKNSINALTKALDATCGNLCQLQWHTCRHSCQVVNTWNSLQHKCLI
jgi:hypothetical protein